MSVDDDFFEGLIPIAEATPNPKRIFLGGIGKSNPRSSARMHEEVVAEGGSQEQCMEKPDMITRHSRQEVVADPPEI
jgi:hypothetical protein